ncbi:MAG: glycosyltransferase [Betaproteobacteria bacterium]
MTTIDLVYFNAGGGHRAAAHALAAAIREQGQPWQVRLVNLTEVLDPRGLFKRYTGMAPEDYYNKRLARGWTLGLAQELKLLQGTIRLAHGALVRPLQQHWLATEPDLVVSLIPNFNRALYDSLASTLPGVPYVTVLTDIADHPPNFWIEPDQDQHFVCGSARAVEQAQALGYGRERVHRVSGMILRPDFYLQPPRDRAAERRALGLEADRPTGLVLFGGHGARTMLDIAQQLDDMQLILLCGHNRALAAALRKLPTRAPRAVVEFTPEVPRYMQLADYFIGKPGPGSLSEAIHMGLPVVTVRNAWTMPQERYNTDWVREHGLGLVHKSFGSLRPVVLQLVERLEEFRANVRRIDNRAVWEVPGILAAILAQAEAPAQPPLQPICA